MTCLPYDAALFRQSCFRWTFFVISLLGCCFLPLSGGFPCGGVAVPRMHSLEFKEKNKENERNGVAYRDKPLIVETGLPVETLCEELMDEISSKTITLQRKSRRTGTTMYECTVDEAIDPIMWKSNHDDSFFAFCEGILDDCENGKQLTGKDLLDDLDWFDYFPVQLRPSDCVVLAGEGATSTLHRDPFEWTGTSLCLEGTKLWRFIDPNADAATGGVGKIDNLLHAYRLPSVAWDDDDGNDGAGISLSAGWQSDFSLFSNRCGSVPSARSLSEDEEERLDKLHSISMDRRLLRPSDEKLDRLHCWTALQKPGDLLLIPAHWWHQTYALEPSLAVASQRCNSKLDAPRVLRHILAATNTWEKAPESLLREDYSEFRQKENVMQVVSTLFDHLERSLPSQQR